MTCMTRRQMTVSLENKLGRLAAICSAIAAKGANVEAISVVDTIDQAVIRFVASEPELARSALKEQGFYVIEAEVLVVDLYDAPGILAKISQALADAQINIDYAYGSSGGPGDHTRVVLKVSNLEKALQVIDGLKGPEPA